MLNKLKEWREKYEGKLLDRKYYNPIGLIVSYSFLDHVHRTLKDPKKEAC